MKDIASPLILCASERNGNSLDAAELASKIFQQSLSGLYRDNISTTQLRGYEIAPCIDCGFCINRKDSRTAYLCPQASTDDSSKLFNALIHAPALFLISPIYFYHLPARLKALIDRTQYYYSSPPVPAFPKRPAFITLIAGRPIGDQLFSGSMLSLKYSLPALGFELQDPLLIKGVDKRGDLLNDLDCVEKISKYAQLSLAALPNG